MPYPMEPSGETSTKRTVHARIRHGLISVFVGTLYRLSRAARLITGKRSFTGQASDVLLTGTFNSEAWIMAFIRPLVSARTINNVFLVTTFPVSNMEGVTIICPPSWLRRAVGDVPARLLVFLIRALRHRPLLVGGFHISINALVADLAASLSGARSMYICVGGPIEVIDGGLWGESRFFSKLKHADPVIERKLLRTVKCFDAVVPMGESAATFFAQRGVEHTRIQPVTGGIDASQLSEVAPARDVDVVFVGRLVPIKSLDVLIRTVRVLVDRSRSPRVRIVGRGPMSEQLVKLSSELGVSEFVEFAGFVDSVFDELTRSKCFILTSKSEGLSLAMIEAMLAGAVPVVSAVGDLGDLVKHGENGYLVESRAPEEFADRIDELLTDEAKLSAFSSAAYTTALQCDIPRVGQKWDSLVSSLSSRSQC